MMKLYIMTDMSRISAVLWGGLGLPPWFNFPELVGGDLRRAMTREVNRAVRGARAAGICECVVHEASPLDWPLLEDVAVVRGGETLYLDASFSGILFAGQGMAGHVRSTTGVEKNLQEIKWNGRRVDELTVCALYAASLGIPTVAVHGVPCAVETLLEWLPDVPVIQDIENELPEKLRQVSFRHSPDLPGGEIITRFRFRVHQLANFHSRLPGVFRIDDTTTETRSEGISGAFSDYCRSGLAVAVDWLENAGVHSSCRK